MTTWTRRGRRTVAGGGLTLLALGGLPAGCSGDEFESCEGSDCADGGAGGSAGADGEATTSTNAGGAGGVDGSTAGSTTTLGDAGGSGGSGGSASEGSGGAGGSLGAGAASAGGSSSSNTDGGEAGEEGTGEGGAGATDPMGACEDTCDGTCCDEVCVDLESNIDHCGVCGVKCALHEAEEACVAGSCVVTQCRDGSVDCNGVASDGCERTALGIPEAPALTRPMLGAFTGSLHARAETGSLRPRFAWAEVDDECELESFDDCDFPSPELDAAGIRTETFTPESDLPVEDVEAPVGRRYYWRVRACEGTVVCSEWSEVFYLDVGRVREDVTGDGYPDVVGATEDAELFIARGGPDFYEEAEFEMIATVQTPLHPEKPQLSFLGDVNGDGFNDVGGAGIVPSRDAQANYVWLGAEAFGTLPGVLVGSGVANPGYPPGVWSAGDHDRDGFADLVLVRRQSNVPVAEWTMKFGDRTLTDSREDELLIRPADPPPSGVVEMEHSATSGDFNGDGYPDFVTDAFPFQEAVAFVLGGPEVPELRTVNLFPQGDLCQPTMATLDFNGDHIDDLAVMCRKELRLAVVIGRRDFAPETVTAGVLKTGLASQFADFAAGDIDDSGFDDLIFSDGTTFLGAAEPNNDSEDFLRTEKTYEPIVVSDHDADGELDVLRAFHWYIGWVTAETWDKELYTTEGEELVVVALAR